MVARSNHASRGWRLPEPATLSVVVIAFIGFAIRVAFLGRSLRAVDRLFIPDDTYYTLTIARSIADGHGPTVDGSTLTSGFQPLLGFLMTPVFWLTSSPDTALRIDLALLVIVDTLTIFVIAWIAHRLAGRAGAIAAAAIWALSPVAISMSLGGLETSLAIFTQVGLVAVWIRARDTDETRRWIVVGVIAGLAVLARIDALALVGLLGALQLWRGSRPGLRPAAIAGAIVVAPWWVWCTVTLGSPFPSSGSAVHELAPYRSFSRETMSLAAGAVSGGPFGIWEWARDELLGDKTLGVVIFWIFVAALVALAILWLRSARRSPERDAWTVASAIPAFGAILLVFYAWFGVTWYFTRYLAPVAWVVTMVIAVAIGALVREAVPAAGRRRSTVLAVIACAGLAIALVASVRTDIDWLRTQNRPVASAGTAAGLDAATGFREPVQNILREIPEGARIAGWQSGALGYYGTGRVVINLDGAVNPDTAGASIPEIVRYLRRRDVDGIVDVPFVVARINLALGQLRPRGHAEIVASTGNEILPYRYARIVWVPPATDPAPESE